ncbi:MAG: TIGR03435 family protein [Terracidiphilus sp.]
MFVLTEHDCNKPTIDGTRTLIAAAFLAIAILCVRIPAQAPAAQSFDVASIHVNNTETDGHHHIISDPAESHFRTVNLALRDLIQFAYGVPDSQILGGPAWIDSVMFDIDAKSDPAVDAELHALPTEQARHQKQLMVQALLADRFQLKVHQETRQLPVYSLVVTKDGPKFKPSKVNGTTIDTGRTRLHIAGSDDTMSILARELAQILGRVVVNKTGLSGRYDLSLRWTPDDATASAPSTLDVPPDIFTAIQEQLGLKLESTKGPVPVLIIDSIEMPSAN